MTILAANHAFLTLSVDFARLCQPLALLNVNHFTYQKQFNDGHRISLSNKPQWLDDYYNLGLYKSSLFEEKPSDYQSGFNVWVGEYDLDVYHHGRQYYNTAHSISVTEPHEDSCEHFLFSTAVNDEKSIQYLANNMDALYHFILFIKDRGNELFVAAEKNKLMVQRRFSNSDIIPPAEDSKQFNQTMARAKQIFLKNTPIHRYLFESGDNCGITLTQREISCIIYLLQSCTAEETAKLMNISRRTVEAYLDNIRLKLNCDTKLELLRKLRRNKFLLALKRE